MRALLLPLLLCALRTSAQCCCADQVVEVSAQEPVHSNGNWQYRADLGLGPAHWSMDSVRGDPNVLRLRMPTGCGVEHAQWTLTSTRTGERMVIHLRHLPGDHHLPDIRLPFTKDRTFHFGLRDILGSAATCGARGGKYHVVDRICHAGRVRHTFDEGQYIRFEPLDMMPWTKEPVPPNAYTAPQEARFLDGPTGMQHYLLQEVGKARIAALPGKVTFTGHVMVEADGSVNEIALERTPYPEIEEAIGTALLLSGRWQPAVVERPGALENTVTYTAIRHTVPVRFVADPATVWGTIGDFDLSVLPSAPTTSDSLGLYFAWYAGSCGTYRDSVVITPPSAERPWTDVEVGIGLVGEDCDDIAMRHRTITLPPQRTGTYRVRFGAAPAGTSPIHPADPFLFREVVVR